MSAPVIPDAIEASCKGPGVWLVQGHAVTRIAPRTWVAEDIAGSFPTLQDAIDRIADHRDTPAAASCRCGARDFPSCLCKLTPTAWVAAHPDRPLA